ncbi:ubiquitin-protein transferase [Aureococcus anophagefferens]|nr:ubiquitin-protein transferase [Aureococcus anophagefferens]
MDWKERQTTKKKDDTVEKARLAREARAQQRQQVKPALALGRAARLLARRRVARLCGERVDRKLGDILKLKAFLATAGKNFVAPAETAAPLLREVAFATPDAARLARVCEAVLVPGLSEAPAGDARRPRGDVAGAPLAPRRRSGSSGPRASRAARRPSSTPSACSRSGVDAAAWLLALGARRRLLVEDASLARPFALAVAAALAATDNAAAVLCDEDAVICWKVVNGAKQPVVASRDRSRPAAPFQLRRVAEALKRGLFAHCWREGGPDRRRDAYGGWRRCARRPVERAEEIRFFDASSPRPTDKTIVRVRRSHVLDDGLDRIAGLSPAALKGRLSVAFVDDWGRAEAGIDAGGLFKEFWTELSGAAFSMDFGLFKTTAHDGLLFPNPDSAFVHGERDHLRLFHFLGRVLGKALREGITIQPRFTRSFLSFVRGDFNYVTLLEDLKSLDRTSTGT